MQQPVDRHRSRVRGVGSSNHPSHSSVCSVCWVGRSRVPPLPMRRDGQARALARGADRRLGPSCHLSLEQYPRGSSQHLWGFPADVRGAQKTAAAFPSRPAGWRLGHLDTHWPNPSQWRSSSAASLFPSGGGGTRSPRRSRGGRGSRQGRHRRSARCQPRLGACRLGWRSFAKHLIFTDPALSGKP